MTPGRGNKTNKSRRKGYICKESKKKFWEIPTWYASTTVENSQTGFMISDQDYKEGKGVN